MLSKSPRPWPPIPIPATLSLLFASYANASLLWRRISKLAPHHAELRRKFRRLRVFFIGPIMPAQWKIVHAHLFNFLKAPALLQINPDHILHPFSKPLS